jgi:V/A-type H+/Na+-transporting ATPase subunit E
MSFDQLQQAILDEAKQQIDEINNRYEKELSTEEERIKQRAQGIEEEIVSRTEKEGQMEAQRLHQSAQLEARADVLAAKQSELDKVLANASAEIIAWDKTQTKSLITSLFELVPETEGTITAGSAHEEIVKELAEKKGLKVNKKVIENEGGFIFKGDKSELNATISHLLKQLFEGERSKIAKTLFG